jgi:hypothetical protein
MSHRRQRGCSIAIGAAAAILAALLTILRQ